MAVPKETVAAFLASLPGLDTILTPTAWFYYYDPEKSIPHDRRQPFATIVTSDEYDGASDLAARGLYRLNMGVEHATYRALLGPEPAWGKDGGVVETEHDLTAVDTFVPHPIYAPMAWISIISPSEANWPRAQAYLREAHALAARAYARRARS